ncbi:RNA polymerase subunit sigma [Streptomyces sp. NPDC089424]|uniref:RNA polymerase subunit sigma n=1 Tax=Streptomyces sp. NPDC089424 TaxID=3365917 RepID=UPI003826273D
MEPVVDTMPLSALLDERRHLVEVAHWMLGSRISAERVTDEAYREWYGLSDHQRARIAVPRAWLTQVVGSISLTRLAPAGDDGDAHDCAHAREPHDVGLANEVDAVLRQAVDRMTPAEKATFVLNSLFGSAHRAAGDAERGHTDPADRARHSSGVRRGRPAFPRRQREIVQAVRQACVEADADRLRSLLAHDVTAFFDGGGKVRALTRPVTGDEHVALSLLTLLARQPRTTLHTRPVNGRTGLVVRYGDQVAAVITFVVVGDRVAQIGVVLNPDKLRSWNRPRP